tara:strand:+ start:861 stop:1256 length:396 start_codon:yes stop_codon:yes gene_type:complete
VAKIGALYKWQGCFLMDLENQPNLLRSVTKSLCSGEPDHKANNDDSVKLLNTLPMSKVPKAILSLLKPHHTHYLHVALADARYWQTSCGNHDDRQLFSMVKGLPVRLKVVNQSNTSNSYAFIKKISVSRKT